MRSSLETRLIGAARARLDTLALYPTPVRTGRVRLFSAPWFFAVPGLRSFVGYCLGPVILVRSPLDEVSDDLVTHELCHTWQCQHRLLRLWLSYLLEGYRHNRHEVEARMAVRLTRQAAAGDQGRR